MGQQRWNELKEQAITGCDNSNSTSDFWNLKVLDHLHPSRKFNDPNNEVVVVISWGGDAEKKHRLWCCGGSQTGRTDDSARLAIPKYR